MLLNVNTVVYSTDPCGSNMCCYILNTVTLEEKGDQ